VETQALAKSPGHPFYERLSKILDEHGFDRFIEEQCARFYATKMGRPSLAPAVYFRLLLIGFFEGIDSERGIAWRLADSMTLRDFLGFELSDTTPDHSTLSRTRRLIDLETHEAVFAWALQVLAKAGLLRGKTLGIDATTLEANAAMRSIVRRDTGESYEDFLTRLAQVSGVETPTRADLARFDRQRKNKKTSNDDWKNPHDPDAKVTRMKDGRTHLAHKAEHAVDMETGAVVAVTVQPADRGDTSSLERTLDEVAAVLEDVVEDSEASDQLSERVRSELVADKGYHSNAVMKAQRQAEIRTYISEPERVRRNWRGKEEEKQAVYANRRRIKGRRGRELSRRRGEKVERTFAHCYETGGMRRTHLRGHDNIRKRLLVHIAGFNLGLQLYGSGTPRALQGLLSALERGFRAACSLLSWLLADESGYWPLRSSIKPAAPVGLNSSRHSWKRTSATGC
jgi:transposase